MARRFTLTRPPRDYDRDPARLMIPIDAGAIDIGDLMYWALLGNTVRAQQNGETFDTSPEVLSPTRAAEVLRDELTAELRAVLRKAREAYEWHRAHDPEGAEALWKTGTRLAYALHGMPTTHPLTGAPVVAPEVAPEAAAVGAGR